MEHKILDMTLNDDICLIKEIWLKCFNDPEDYFNSFLNRFYSPECMLTYKIDNKIVSVFCIVPCTSDLGNTAYLFALATLPEYRGRFPRIYGSKPLRSPSTVPPNMHQISYRTII